MLSGLLDYPLQYCFSTVSSRPYQVQDSSIGPTEKNDDSRQHFVTDLYKYIYAFAPPWSMNINMILLLF